MVQRQWAILAALGGVAIAIGSVLPWATLTGGFGSTASIAGTEGDGILTLAAGVVAAILGFAAYASGNRAAALFAALSGVAAGLVALLAMSRLSESVKAASSANLRASIGIGLWIVVAGAVVAIAGGIMARGVPASPPWNEESPPR